MKANELMLGDIVKQVGSDLIIQVTAIYGNYIQGKKEDGEYKEDTVEPIHLTDEIMEANGFGNEVTGCDCYGKWQMIKGINAINVSPGFIEYKSIHNMSFSFRLNVHFFESKWDITRF